MQLSLSGYFHCQKHHFDMEEQLFKVLVWVQFWRAFLSFRSPKGIGTYGRHLAPRFGEMLTLPPQIAWIVMEVPAVIVPILVFIRGEHSNESVPRILLLVFEAHYFHRAFIYPLRISRAATKMPAFTAILGALFNGLNTYMQARWMSHFGVYPSWWLQSPQFLLGISMFFTGMVVNIWADSVLISLRKSSEDRRYKVPTGGLYEYISCPNYLGEIIEWLGWAILSWSAAGLGFFLYTVATLAPRAIAHHQWYLKKFPEYPQHKKALVPFLY